MKVFTEKYVSYLRNTHGREYAVSTLDIMLLSSANVSIGPGPFQTLHINLCYCLVCYPSSWGKNNQKVSSHCIFKEKYTVNIMVQTDTQVATQRS